MTATDKIIDELLAKKAEQEQQYSEIKTALDICAAYRLHVYECEACADEEACEQGFDMWDASIKAIDVIYGVPQDIESESE